MMVTRVFRGKEIPAILSEIRQQHGDEAVILSTRELGREGIEVRVGIPKEQPSSQVVMVSEGNVSSQPSVAWPNLQERNGNRATIRELLHGQVMDSAVIDAILAKLPARITKKNSITAELAKALSEVIPFKTRFPNGRKVVAFLGATGVGKTTTIAKLAARLREALGLRIALISADYVRVGAGYHLQTYASLLQVPCSMIDTNYSLGEAIDRAVAPFKDYDAVFIDMPGTSPRDNKRIAELKSWLDSRPQVERALLLPAPGNSKDLRYTAQMFGRLEIHRLILTKLDESGCIGPVLSAAYWSGRPVSFLTTGQRVPEDIEPASAERLAWMLSRTMH